MGKLTKAFAALMAVMLFMTVISRAASSFTVAQVQVESPKSRAFVHKVIGDGTVTRQSDLPVYTVADILVAKVKVTEGQEVKKGQTLAVLDTDSIDEQIQTLSDEIEVLQLQNDALKSAEAKRDREQDKALSRAKEDYEDTVQSNKDAVSKAKENIKTAKKQTKKNEKKTLEDLQNSVEEAKKAYEDAVETQKSQVQQAKRALEDASKTPAADYSDSITQIEINQKQRKIDSEQRKLDALALKKLEDPDTYTSEWQDQYDYVQELKDDLAAAKLQQQAKKNEAAAQERERKQTLSRAQEDYDETISKNEKLVRKAKELWQEAEQKLENYQNGEDEDSADDSLVEDARKTLEDAKSQQTQQKKSAKRAIEDAGETDAVDHSVEINNVSIAEKQRALAQLQKTKEQEGKIVAQTDATVSKILLTAGDRTTETAAFLLADLSEGARFTTEISKEDAKYVVVGDVVTLKVNDKSYEDMTVLSTETNEDSSVRVTVYVPKKTISIGTHASMEIEQTSEKYATTLPLTAIHAEQSKYFVYVLEKEDTVLGEETVARKVNVSIVEKNGEYAALSDGSLSEDDSVIVESDTMLANGEKVRLKEAGAM
ncbi:MAG: biotin/lipoyl-binding protein [Agathobacter sp.]|nr:biotin/lipoyl-binding protein [Agathobacter sp.]